MSGDGISFAVSGRAGLAALDLAAVACRQKHERLGISGLGGLAGTRMGAFSAIVLGGGIDAVALFQLVLAHSFLVVLHDLRRIGHALSAHGRSLRRERETNGGR